MCLEVSHHDQSDIVDLSNRLNSYIKSPIQLPGLTGWPVIIGSWSSSLADKPVRNENPDLVWGREIVLPEALAMFAFKASS
eukprot:scaffold58986_cov12-Tisochrysis_lutea.AAC.1